MDFAFVSHLSDIIFLLVIGPLPRLAAKGLKLIGLPKTIYNDLMRTFTTFGFDTAVAVATISIDRLHTNAA